MSRLNQNTAEDKECVIVGASLSPTDRIKHLTEAFPPKLVLTLRRPRYSYYKQVLVSPYMQLMLSPRGCPLEKKGYEVHVLSQEHSGDVCNNCHTLEPQWFQYSPKIIDSKISENNTMVKNTKMLENYLVSDTKKTENSFWYQNTPKMVEYMCN